MNLLLGRTQFSRDGLTISSSNQDAKIRLQSAPNNIG